MLRAGRVDEVDPENAGRLKARTGVKDDGFPNQAAITGRITTITRRMPLSDKSNLHKNAAGATDYQSSKQSEQSRVMNGTQVNDSNGNDNAWWTVSTEERIRELENALRETLEENRQVHTMMKKLKRENERLQERSRQLDLVSMLYEAAKKELAEYQLCERDHVKLDSAGSDDNDDSKKINRV